MVMFRPPSSTEMHASKPKHSSAETMLCADKLLPSSFCRLMQDRHLNSGLTLSVCTVTDYDKACTCVLLKTVKAALCWWAAVT